MHEKIVGSTGAEWNAWWITGLPSTPRLPRRVRTGCDGCRRRKVKCDEGRPICRRCARNGDQCQYSTKAWIFEPGNSTPPSQKSSVMQTLKTPYVQTNDPMALEFFFRCIAPVNSRYHSLECWDTPFVHRLHSEPAVVHLLTALGIVHRSYWDGSDQVVDQSGSYYKSVHAAVAHLVTSKRTGPASGKARRGIAYPSKAAEAQLLCSLLLIMAEGTRSASAMAIWPHICDLITLFSASKRLMPVLYTDAATNMARLRYDSRLLAVSTGMTMSSLAFTSVETFYDEPSLPSLRHCVSTVTPNVLPQVACTFMNLDEAAHSLENIILFWFLPLLRRPATWIAPYPPLKAINLLTQWRMSLRNNLDSGRHTLISISDARLTAQLKMHTSCAYIAATCYASQTPKSAYNAAIPQFRNILAALEFITADYTHDKDPFTLYAPLHRSIGLIPPAFFTATHCPDKEIAAHALAILHSLNVTEGVWNSGIAATIAEATMAIEQELRSTLADDLATHEIWPCVAPESTECHLMPATPRSNTASLRTVMLRIRFTIITPADPPPAFASPFSANQDSPNEQTTLQRTSFMREVTLKRSADRTQALGPCVRTWGYLAHSDLFPTPYVQSETSASEFMERYIS